MNRRTSLRLALLAAALPVAAWAEPTRVIITHSSPETSHFGLAAHAFAASVEAAAGDRWDVEVQRQDNEREALETVQLGAQEFAISSAGPLGNFVPEARVFDIPFLFRDYPHARAVLDGATGQEILGRFTDAGLTGIAWGENGFRHLTTSDAVAAMPADLAGLKVRTMENQVHMQAWTAAGVLPTPMAFSELPPALQQGTVDGQENPIPVILANNFDQLQGYLYLTAHVYSPGIIVGSPAFLDGLAPDDRAVFDAAAAEAVQVNRAKVEDDERSGIEELRARGMTVEEVDRVAVEAAMAGALPEFEAEFGADLIASIRATISP